MSQHLPILQVLLPLLAAPVCLLLPGWRWARALTVLVAWTVFAVAAALLTRVLREGPISYALGGWEPPLGIEYRVTVTGAFVLLLVSAIAAVVLSFDWRGAASRVEADRRQLYYALFLLAIAGLLGMAITGDAFNVFVFLEISSLSSYALIAMGRERRALMAAFSYLIVGTIGGTFFLLGVGMLYQMTGTLNLVDLAVRLQPALGTRTALVAFSLLSVGIGIKLAVFPLHQWLPNAYSFGPSKVAAFLAGTATKVSFYVLVRIVFTVFGASFVFTTLRFDYLLVPLSVAAMFVASAAAIYQRNLKRLLAYSSIAQVGYMTLGLSFNSSLGLTGGLVHLFNHGLMKSGLFLVVACVVYRLGSERLSDLEGLGRRMPLTAAAFVVGGLSLVGVPGTVGFISKWYLVWAALERGWIPVAILILLSSLLSLVYVWRVVEVAYFSTGKEPVERQEAPLGMLLPTWALAAASVYFGLHTELTVGVATRAANELLGAIP